jgi:Immunity protein 42
MLFGDKNFFAIETELETDYEGEWLLGRICYWVNSVQLGDFYHITSLRDALPMIKWIIHDKGNRDGENLCELNSEEVFNLLDEFLYKEGNWQQPVLPETPARFKVSIPLETLLEWKLFLIQCKGKERLIYKKHNNDDALEIVLDIGQFDEVIENFYQYLDDLHEKEVKH